jgi:hypothetical protein
MRSANPLLLDDAVAASKLMFTHPSDIEVHPLIV